jgi:hypothetical protein
MRRYLLIAVALGACAWAAGDVRVFVTSSTSGYGLDLLGPQGDGTGTDPEHEDWPIDPLRPTYSTVENGWNYYAYDYGYGYFRAAAYPPINAPSGTVDDPILINAAAGAWAYIWFQFRDEPSGANLDYLTSTATVAGQSPPTQDLSFTYYVQNDLGASGAKRWWGDATPPDYSEWRLNPAYFLGEAGITNAADRPEMMFDHQAPGTGVALFGALTGMPSGATYELKISDVNYANAELPRPLVGESCFFKIVPEPAGIWLWANVAIGLRRRR